MTLRVTPLQVKIKDYGKPHRAEKMILSALYIWIQSTEGVKEHIGKKFRLVAPPSFLEDCSNGEAGNHGNDNRHYPI